MRAITRGRRVSKTRMDKLLADSGQVCMEFLTRPLHRRVNRNQREISTGAITEESALVADLETPEDRSLQDINVSVQLWSIAERRPKSHFTLSGPR